MLAMDVVDTLRHRQRLVEQELAGPESDEAMLERLRRIYAAQGIEVPDRILREGVEALREDRFAYRPPRNVPLWARIYVHRGLWARRVLALVVAALVAWGAWTFAVVAPRQALAEDIEESHAAITAVAADDEVVDEADALYAQASAALEEGDAAEAREAFSELDDLRTRLERSYELLIATGPDSAIGVWRIPDVNQATRNYYLIVEAIDEGGARVTLPVRSEETGAVERVSTFGVRVDEDTWEDVAADLDDDGIIQDRLVGVKRRGELEPEYLVDTPGGMITRW